MKWAVGITTAPRSEPTLARTVASLEHAGWSGEINVYADAEGNAWLHWKRTLRQLLDRHADRILICQDDLVACRGLRAFLEAESWPESAAWLSPYTPRKYRSRESGWHHWGHRGRNLCSALCMVMRPQIACQLLFDPMIQSKHWTGPKLGKSGTPEYLDTCCIDGKCGSWADKYRHRVYYHTPSLVDHIGVRNSSMDSPHNPKASCAADFVGEDWEPGMPFDPKKRESTSVALSMQPDDMQADQLPQAAPRQGGIVPHGR